MRTSQRQTYTIKRGARFFRARRGTLMRPPVATRQTKYYVSITTLVSVALVGMLLTSCTDAIFQKRPQPAPSATATPRPSATLPASIQSIQAPTLGGTIKDFLARYQVVAGTQNLVYDATIAGQRVEIALGPDLPTQSLDGVAHIAVVTVDAPANALAVERWSASLADQIAQTFLPADAQFQRTVKAQGALDHIYTSAGLAATFTPDQFVTDANTPVPVGAFDYLCNPLPRSNTGYEQCTVAIGTN